jgi:enoyl-CoA hydratase
MTESTATELVLSEREGGIAIVTMNRHDRLNALNDELLGGVVDAIETADADTDIHCIVLAGGEKAFAAGADIGEMANATAMDMYAGRRLDRYDRIRAVRTPIVAAVSGFCLGGGNEVAMSCDLIVCSPTARFGQPETGVGIIPGAGGTQRLVRAVGKSLAMDVILSGRFLNAEEALWAGLVARIADDWLGEAKAVAATIASKAPHATEIAKELVDHAYEATLTTGIDDERKAFYLAFAAEDAREGLTAFVEKRKPEWSGR